MNFSTRLQVSREGFQVSLQRTQFRSSGRSAALPPPPPLPFCSKMEMPPQAWKKRRFLARVSQLGWGCQNFRKTVV